jgi:uncharacterized protein YacL
MDQTLLLFRALFLTACGVAGWFIASVPLGSKPWSPELGSFLGLALGLFVILVDRLTKGVSLRAFSSATFGLTLGCVLATLLFSSGLFDKGVDEHTQWIIRLTIYLVFGYLGTMLALRSNRDEFSLLIPYVRFIGQEPHEQITLLDTSSIIDGRVADLCKGGFLDGTLIVPRFVLEELQALADCPDATKRARGRHGLDLLNELKKNPALEIKIHETIDVKEAVDARLIHLARLLNARIATTDYNLGRVAELQKVRVLNIHLLAAVLRPSLMTGEKLTIKLVREGKEAHQAVGFMPDGTMIVVNHARHLIGQDAELAISGAIQTTAGRMVFAEIIRESPAGVSSSGETR